MPLRLRLALTYAAIMLLVELASGAVLYNLEVHSVQLAFQQDLERLTKVVGQFGSQAQPGGGLPEDVRLHWLNVQGKALSAKEIPALPEGVFASAPLGKAISVAPFGPDRSWWLVTQPWLGLYRNDQGALLLETNNRRVVDQLARWRSNFTMWLMVSTLLALLAGFLLAVHVTRPLRRIAVVAEAVEAGDLSQRIPSTGQRDEIGLLERRFNAMLDRLEQVMDVQRRFTTDAAHDLRTPLAVMKSDLEITLRRSRSQQEYHEALIRHQTELDRVVRMAEDLLLLARLETESARLDQVFLLRDAVESVLPTYSRSAKLKGLELSVFVPEHMQIRGDVGLVARAVANLLSNAVTHTAQGALGLTAESRNDRVLVRVWDTGPGVLEAQRQKVFERFRKGERSAGTGLGLAIVAEVTAAHQGRVWVEARPGGGSVFVLELPQVA